MTEVRMSVFDKACGWQAWNPDPVMEAKSARLPGSGSFYWPSAREAYKWASHQIRFHWWSIQQIKLETNSGAEICRLFNSGKGIVRAY